MAISKNPSKILDNSTIIKYIDDIKATNYVYSYIKPKYKIKKDKNRIVGFIIVSNKKELKEYNNFYSNYMKDFLLVSV